MNLNKGYDVLIIGGGLAGLTLACALRNTPLKIGIVEANSLPVYSDAADYSTRVSAINRASQRIFENVGIWSAIESSRLSPYKRMCVWEEGNHSPLWFDCRELSSIPPEENLGHIIENQVMQNALIKHLQLAENVTWMVLRKLTRICYDEKIIKVTLDDGEQLATNLLVGADGMNSAVRQLAGLGSDEADYGHYAIVTNVRTSLPHQNTAWQCFLKSGPLAFLPLPDPHTCSIVWSTSPTEADKLSRLPLQAFESCLTTAFEQRLGTVEAIAPLSVIPLRRMHAQRYTATNIALIGDAAHRIHPLAGQGANLGFLDAACLAENVLKAHQKNQSIADISVLRQYERQRKLHNTTMLLAMDGFKRLFQNQNLLIKWARRRGMQLVNNAPFIKKALMSSAMGLSGDLPTLAKIPL